MKHILKLLSPINVFKNKKYFIIDAFSEKIWRKIIFKKISEFRFFKPLNWKLVFLIYTNSFVNTDLCVMTGETTSVNILAQTFSAPFPCREYLTEQIIKWFYQNDGTVCYSLYGQIGCKEMVVQYFQLIRGRWLS